MNPVDREGKTPLQYSLAHPTTFEILLDHGGRGVSEASLAHFAPCDMVYKKRQQCKAAALAVYGILRKRFTVAVDDTKRARIPRDMVRLCSEYVWGTRRDPAWHREPPPTKKRAKRGQLAK